ncbi:hypothetical protein nbrc107696_27030 [Gordonia spumicola]|uniref:Helicase superfamily 3 single-stranded DNA/RNA virus domain-containing protein n=1 Tax=Gordonia spumicola TaxID=589161 RepID=A0A7I9VA95_9ACTN|nr:hypothetical protein [Gordonia spumicola]GEE02257.1 hypothetical protein nbrc107696_27030 [Gordonia spumicola]
MTTDTPASIGVDWTCVRIPITATDFEIKTDSDAGVTFDDSEVSPETIDGLHFHPPMRARHFLGWRASVSETDTVAALETTANATPLETDAVDFADLDVPGADPSDDVSPVVVVSTPEQVAEARAFFARAKADESAAQKQRTRKVSRVFSAMQYHRNPATGEVMFTQEQLDAGLAALADRLFRWAYIWHDRDRLVEVDAGTGDAVCCGIKGLHAHLVLWVADGDGARPTIRTVSDAFEIPSAKVRVPNEVDEIEKRAGRGAAEKVFFDLCEYLPHESRGSGAIPGIHQLDRHYLVDKTQPGKPGKYQYGRGRVVANFHFGRALDTHMATRHNAATDGGTAAQLSKLYQAVGNGSMNLRQVREAEPAIYFAKGTIAHLQKCRDDYLLNAPLPPFRTNYYIGGAARTGKSTVAQLFARALARTLYPDLTEDEAIYMVGRPGVAFQSYDGQPIVIWDDYRPLSIIEAVGGDVRQRDSIWPVLDISPKRVEVNKKFGAVTLLNAVNIITGIQSYGEFLDGLAGEYTDKKTGARVEVEDKNQAYGRFPFVSEVTPETISFYLNRGFAGRSGSYQDFDPVARIKANMARVIDALDALPTEEAKEQFRLAAGQKMLGGMVQAHLELRSAPEALTVDGALAELEATTVVQTADDIAAEDAENERQRAAAEAARTARHAAHRTYHEADPAAPASACTFDHGDHACTWDPARAGFDPWRVPMPA